MSALESPHICGGCGEPVIHGLDQCIAANPDLRTLPGHPTKDGAGYECCCGACLSLPARQDLTGGE